MFTSILEPSHLLIIMIVALVFLGPKRLPAAGRSLGQGLRELRSAINGPPESAPITQSPEHDHDGEG